MTAEIWTYTRSIQILLMYRYHMYCNIKAKEFQIFNHISLTWKKVFRENFSGLQTEISQNLFSNQSILFHHNSIFFHLHPLPYLIFSLVVNWMRDHSSQRTLCLMRIDLSQGKSHFKCFFVVM